ncbi:hypothetical protein [Bacillus sp. Marseille-P3661]|uniref:hypothetical protein n=1 Tax=Bacillus sp. Marseille-P3661 TaxID=1936234 RepID=UPI000C848771|nr:hypothetical protein [Bacillus sp. Marseille-P3661]
MKFTLLNYEDAYVLVEIGKLNRGKYQVAVIDENYPFQSVEIDEITFSLFFEMKDIVITQCRIDPITLQELGINIFGLPQEEWRKYYVIDKKGDSGLLI